MEKNKLQWILITLVVLIPYLIFYGLEHPDSLIARCLWMEPSYVKVRKGEAMMDAFVSYSSAEDVLTQLNFYSELNVDTSTVDLGSGRYGPPSKRYIVNVAHYVNLDVEGFLSFVFFNDRLSSMIFYPQNPLTYKENLMKDQNLKVRLNERIKVGPHMTLEYKEELSSQKIYFKWEDQRLKAEENAWMMRHS